VTKVTAIIESFIQAVLTRAPMPIRVDSLVGHRTGRDHGWREPAERPAGADVSAITASRLGWHTRRAARMSPAEMVWRAREQVLRADLAQPDWFHDSVTGRKSSPDRYAFRIDHGSEEENGNIKQIWEISHLEHLTFLGTAWFLIHDERYASRVAGPAPFLVVSESFPLGYSLGERNRDRHPTYPDSIVAEISQ
jgi:hypothetical protein